MTVKMTRVPVTALTSKDAAWLGKATNNSIDDFTQLDFIESAAQGYSAIFRLEGDVEGVVVLTQATPGVRITGLAGKGLLRHFQEVHEQILVTAAGAGAAFVDGFVKRKGLAEIYKKKTSARFAEYFKEDLVQ